MIPELLWIIGCYAAAVLAAHAVYRRSAGGERHHYVLVAGNHESEIEGCVRALQRYSRRTGTEVGITVVLNESTDETGAIVERFSREGEGIGWIRHDHEEAMLKLHDGERSQAEKPWEGAGEVTWIDLGIREHVARLPMWRRW